MADHRPPGEKPSELELRIKSLEQQARLTYDILDMAATLGDFQTSINQLQEPTDILRETTARIQGFIPFQATAYYLVDERTQDFAMTLCLPPQQQEDLGVEVDYLIENGVFSLALRENSPIHVHSRTGKLRLVLHSLSTSSRTRGMFVGLLGRTDRTVSGLVLSLLSIILKNCANAIESFELYRLFRENEQRYRELADFLPHVLFETDADGRLLFMNQSVGRLFSELPAQSLSLTDLLLPEDRPGLLQELDRKRGQSEGFDLPVRVVWGLPAPREVRLRMRPILRQEQCTGWRGVLLFDEAGPASQG